MAVRTVPEATAWRIARSTLGRMACAYADPADKGHDHAAECLHDDEALVADRMLRLLAAAVTGDEDQVLDRLGDLMENIERDK